MNVPRGTLYAKKRFLGNFNSKKKILVIKKTFFEGNLLQKKKKVVNM